MEYITKGAHFSECGKFRYRLWRRWSEGRALVFIMLNPSTADGLSDDHTIRKCVWFAKMFGYGAIEVVNLFAYCATKPSALKTAGFPVGPDNDMHLNAVLSGSGAVVCAWGVNAKGLPRVAEVMQLVHDHYHDAYALRQSDGVPHHPLMLPYSCTLEPFKLWELEE